MYVDSVGAFGADPFFDDLNENFIAPLKDLLDWRLVARAAAGDGGWTTATAIAIASRAIVFPLVICPSFLLNDLVRIVTALAEIVRLDIADMQEAILTDAKINKYRLDTGLQIDDFAFVYVAYPIVLAGAFNIKFFQATIFDDRDPAFFVLRRIDQHFFFHDLYFHWGPASDPVPEFCLFCPYRIACDLAGDRGGFPSEYVSAASNTLAALQLRKSRFELPEERR